MCLNLVVCIHLNVNLSLLVEYKPHLKSKIYSRHRDQKLPFYDLLPCLHADKPWFDVSMRARTFSFPFTIHCSTTAPFQQSCKTRESTCESDCMLKPTWCQAVLSKIQTWVGKKKLPYYVTLLGWMSKYSDLPEEITFQDWLWLIIVRVSETRQASCCIARSMNQLN